MSNDTTYNGWTNWATWNVNLWAMNDEYIYRMVMRNQPYDADNVEKMVRRHIYPEGTPDMDSAKEMDDVNWEEIAEGWNEE